MTDVRQTDERLRSYLNSRQPDRERICLALLKLDKSYTQIEPRRPEGGPDGARDVQCFVNDTKCFGAVGFKNNANDSDEQIREIKKKFKDDLAAALESEPTLRGFVFFTNVDLTPAVQEELKVHARGCGLNHVELLYRERLRILLDTVEGYAIRFSFLDIPLSDAEQKDFFARFGSEIQNLVVGKLEAVELRMEEIQYRNWMRGRCRDISVRVKLKKLYRAEGIDHEPYRFALRLHRVLMYGDGEMLFGCYSVIKQDERWADFEVKKFIYTDTSMLPGEQKTHTHFPSGTRCLNQPFETIEFGCALSNASPLVTEYGFDIAKLGQYVIDFYCDSAWAGRVETVEVWYDDYLVYEFRNDGKRVRADEHKHGIPHWPEEASHLKDRPVQYWHGWAHGLDRVCRRRKIGER